MTNEMELVVGCDGIARCIYDEALDLREIGKLRITRASHVEPDHEGYWFADMGPSGGPLLGPFRSRTEALEAEREWLAMHALECRTIDVYSDGIRPNAGGAAAGRDDFHPNPKA